MPHNHGIEYQIKVIHENGTEVLSEWIDPGTVAQAMGSLRKPQAKAYWLRERRIAVATCPLCRDQETAIAEYPLTDSLSPRSRPHDSSYLVLTGSKDRCDLQVIRSKSAGR